MAQLLGTIVASPLVQGNSDIDSYGTHYAFLGVGGYQERATIAERNGIQINPSNILGLDGLSSGRRRLGMLVYVHETNVTYQLHVPFSTWTGLTNTQKVAALANNANWIEYSTGTGGDAIKKAYPQTSHGFIVGDVVAYNGSIFVKKSAGPFDVNETIGIVSKADDPNVFTVTYAGFIDTTSISGLSANTVYYVSPTIAGGLTSVPPSNLGEENRPILITQTSTSGIVVQYRGQIITDNIISGSSGNTYVAGVIGPAEDGTYTDGLFTDFVPTTPTGTAIDRFNELFKLIVPKPAPDLNNIVKSAPTLNSARLSFGPSKSIAGYTNVSNTPVGNGVVDINGLYAQAGTRLGATNAAISGVLNDNVTATTSYIGKAFNDGDKGELLLYVNGLLDGQLILSGTTAATSNSRFSVSQVYSTTFPNNNPFDVFKYRTGTFTIPTGSMINGFNYARVIHNRPSGSVQTNYLEWIYDSNANALSASAVSLSGLVLTGSRYISGVRYNTGGTVTYNATIANAYRNLYANGNAISYPSRFNLSDATIISKTGTGLTTDISASKTLPLLNTGVTSPELSSLVLASTHNLQNNILGNIGTLGKIETNISVLHPVKASFTGGVVSNTGFLQYTTVQSLNLKTENFTGEGSRVDDRDYTPLTYANIDGVTYAWDSTQSLVGANVNHNTGLLVFNGELMYPNSSYLNTQYGINNGNFGGVTNILAGNPNYSTASGVRVYNRIFKSTNATTQSTLTIEFLHTGTNSSFLLDGGTGGVPNANFIKVECIIKRSGGATHGWFNPFANTGNPEGIANTAISTIAGGTSVTCSLSTVPRIGNGDILIVRIKAASGWTNRISNINVVNI